ncbi:3'-5' exoribonuclease domain-containing protein [Rhodococcus sp. NPDC056506]|uniref:3'-5' exoribonuclease domain-containing protein n=1 Tax=Rhodococcus sp. NPDC056506 TaxID=3345844 RepID=UPI00367300CE
MRYFYDTEFIEDGKTIDPISIGIVAENGREYYAESVDAPWDRIVKHDWLMANVVPQLERESMRKRRSQIRDEVSEFLKPRHKRDQVELWAWFGAYDHVCLAQLFGTMMDFPKHVPMWTNDFRQEVHRLGIGKMPAQPAGLHNALADAKHLKANFEYVAEIVEGNR